KRLRPLLFLATLETLNYKISESELRIACGIELIHTYSLIHDDLPAMDNDDYRRGKLTSHKKWGEAEAILAGDALLPLG
ncbi:polyprenyl synthetase family protein, partial [Escherichia coli]|nr:polyprenyl synthetase family protein [Escherichia coli]